MVIGFIVLSAVFGIVCAFASLLLGYGLLVAFFCYMISGSLALLFMIFYIDLYRLMKALHRNLISTLKALRP